MTCKECVEHANITGAIKTATGYAQTIRVSISVIGRNGLIAASAARREKEIENMGQITKLVQEAHETAVAHGWWENPPEFGTLIALCHSELSEALEDYRNGRLPEWSFINKSVIEGIPLELADVVIRIFDMCGHYGIDLETAIVEKMKYNQTRPYKHGGKLV